jgi:hypothetical protein
MRILGCTFRVSYVYTKGVTCIYYGCYMYILRVLHVYTTGVVGVRASSRDGRLWLRSRDPELTPHQRPTWRS